MSPIFADLKNGSISLKELLMEVSVSDRRKEYKLSLIRLLSVSIGVIRLSAEG